jgi:hypothetical protein
MPPVTELAQQVQKQQLADFVFNLKAEEYPVTSMISKGKAVEASTFTHSVEDTPRAPHTGVRNGEDVSDFSGVLRLPVVAIVQEFRQAWGVDQRAKVTGYGGVPKGQEAAHQKALAMDMLRQQMEAATCSNNEMQMATALLPYEMRGAYMWLSATAQAVNPVPAAFRPAAAAVMDGTTMASVTEAAYETLMNKIFRARRGGSPTLHQFGGELLQAQVNKFSVQSDAGSAFATFPVRSWSQQAGSVVRAVTKLTFSNGTIVLHQSAHQMITKATGEDSTYTPYSGLVLDIETWDTRWQQSIEKHDLEEKGGGPRGYLNCMMGLVCSQPKRNTYITAES